MARVIEVPEGLRVAADGSWRVGEEPVRHELALLHFKRHLEFDDAGGFVTQAGRRLSVAVDGPPFVVVRLTLDEAASTAAAELDDGSLEPLADLAMDERSGRFECAARGGRARALFSRGAHQTLLDHALEEDGRFYLRVGVNRIPIRT